MNRLRAKLPLVIAVATLVLSGGRLAASEGYRLETKVYVFKDGDFQSITLPAVQGRDNRQRIVIPSPATIGFDREKLALAGADFSWSGGPNPPEQFTQIKTPWIVTPAGRTAEMLSTAPVQYIERKADGTYRVRDIGKDSPEAPHCRFKFTVLPPDGDEAGGDLRVSCELDIATIAAREKVPGLSLDVGKPRLARFHDQAELAVRSGEWAALLLRTPNGSDYSLLLLIKAMPAPADAGGAAQSGRLMTAQEFSRFATYYYQHPQPELMAKALESLGTNQFVKKISRISRDSKVGCYTFIGFFAKVFADNPGKVAEWRRIIDQRVEDWKTRSWLHKALKLGRPGAILALKPDGFGGLSEFSTYVCWGAFFASGQSAYVKQLVDRLRLVDGPFGAGAAAMSSLAFQAHYHPLVRQTLESARREADPRTRKLIADVLTKDMGAVLAELAKMYNGPSGPSDSYTGNEQYPWGIPLPNPNATFGDGRSN